MLQGVAWVKMLVTYSQTEGVQEGLKMTFDGEHPCEMCRMISQAKKQLPANPEAPAPDTKIGKAVNDFALPEEIRLPILNTQTVTIGEQRTDDQRFEPRDGSPPIPPPRLG